MRRLYFVSDQSAQEALSALTERLIDLAFASGDLAQGKAAAYFWANSLAPHLGLGNVTNWKYFKRELVAKWFGRLERKRFEPGWTLAEVGGYVRSLGHRGVRASSFPPSIACHAVSVCLPDWQDPGFDGVLSTLDVSQPLEVFPESSTERTICFRRYSSEFAEEVVYEAGTGQAMLVFEAEQGRHRMSRATGHFGQFTFARKDQVDDPTDLAVEGLRTLVHLRNVELERKTFGVCRVLGIQSLAFEGYYDRTSDALTIVDIDLPWDFVFMDLAERVSPLRTPTRGV